MNHRNICSTLSIMILILFLITTSSVSASTTPSPNANMKNILVVKQDNPYFNQVYDILIPILSKKYKCLELQFTQKTTYKEFEEYLQKNSIYFTVLIDNTSVSYMIQYNNKHPIEPIQGIALLALNLNQVLEKNQYKYISGIEFEIPGYLMLTSFRSIVDRPIKHVLVFYRKSFNGKLIMEARKHLIKEGILLHAVDVEESDSNNNSSSQYLDIMNSYKNDYLESGKKFDAQWVLLDPVLTSPELITKYWSILGRRSKVPIITSLPYFLDPKTKLASFGMNPDLEEMTQMVMEQINSTLENKGLLDATSETTQKIIDTISYLNMDKLKELKIPVNKNNLNKMDVVIIQEEK